MGRQLRWFILGALLAAMLVIVSAWWITSTPSALQWLIAEAVSRSNGTLSFEGVSGSLLGRVRVQKLTYTAKHQRVTLEDVALQLSRDALMQRKLEVVAVEAALMDVQTTPSGEPSVMPDSLALPIDFDIKRVEIKQARHQKQVVQNLTFGYRAGNAGHELYRLGADTTWGQLTGEFRIAATHPFALSGQARLDRGDQWNLHVTLGGDLLTTHATASGSARGARFDATAQVALFEPVWLRAIHARGEHIDTTAFATDVPAALISFDLAGSGAPNGWSAGTLTLSNAMPGTLTAKRLPVRTLSANYLMQDATTVVLSKLTANLGAAGAATGSARLAPDAISVDLALRALDLRAMHAPLRHTRLSGTVMAIADSSGQRVRLNLAEGGIRLALDGNRRGDVITVQHLRAQAGTGTLQASGEVTWAGAKPFRARATLDRLDPAALGDFPQAAITGRFDVNGSVATHWHANVALTLLNSQFRDARVNGEATGEVSAAGARDIRLDLRAGANTLQASGGIGRRGDKLEFKLNAPRLSQLTPELTGAFMVMGSVGGDIRQPQIHADISGDSLEFKKQMRIDTLRARIGGTLAQHTATVAARNPEFDLNASVEVGWDPTRGWSGALVSLRNTGRYPVALLAPMPVVLAPGRYSGGPARATVAGGRVDVTQILWHKGRLDSSGEITNFPVAALLALASAPATRTTLRLNGAWSLNTAQGLNGHVSLFRESGDIMTPGDTSIALGLQQLRLDGRLANGALNLTLALLSQTINGNAHLTTTSLSREAALQLDGKFDIASLRVLDAMWGTQALTRGSATLTVSGRGTLGAPQLNGTVAAVNLGIEAPQYGVRLRDGTLRAALDDNALTLHEFAIRGDEGTLAATGKIARAVGGETRVVWSADHLRVLNRPDMQLKVNGSGTIALADKKLMLRGSLSADEGRFVLDTPKAPKLATDIVVLGRPRAAATSERRASFQTALLDVDVVLDAGERFHLSGAGLDTDLRGKINLKTNPRGVVEARGVLSSRRGAYYAFGQRLEIDRARLLFDGPLDNPALDIAARRKNLAVEAGVEVTGTAQVPNVRLVSEPPVSDGEKLAWLTLGRGLQEASGGDLALLQAAAAALISKGNTVPLTQRVANRLGLDALTLSGSGEAGGQVAAMGKRLSDRLYIEYQQGLAATSAALRLSYQLSRGLSLRLETGFASGWGIYFTRSYE